MKRVLVVYYTQSGQLKEIIDSVLSPLTEVTIDFLPIDTAEPFPFPWTDDTFFDAFPESYLQIPQPLQPFNLSHTDYDLVILGYQVWYLSPSIPFNSFLQHPEAKKLLSDKPVITISGTRNMWVMAHQKVKKLLTDCGAHLVGNIALTDRHHNHISVITIVQWLFSGDKNKRYLGVFPKAGVADKDIQGASVYGTLIAPHLQTGDYTGLQQEIVAHGGVHYKRFLLSAEKKGNRLFGIWAKMIYGSKKRKFLLKCFRIYLYIAIWVLMPIVWLLYWLTYPLFFWKVESDKKKFTIDN
ncbi:dialkylresorcinol condensing enzyme DarA [Capnocytophaga genosp. AHN8471]|uniref:Dialkylresorcinol condensing enzyme DarA n=1 Tax=Capnocytophaga genosp. AHN8471 TaxID=327574 RepID=A0ABS1YSC7_9FLAO|nr:dialkylrecorsinol condensing enzyme DarA [Capnocytophaga genosp. AHN8471]MBM0649157.1 dialkylresorcinol condensing enzyme DarA [Capnocytophaga genosp. AHN8471]MBM0661497.1 dialkylresorcinol condensing enzyme DarA [Capnocytophaga genosp. AHN8471]